MDPTKSSDHRGGFERRAFQAERVKPRRTSFSFPLDVPKHWLGNSPTRTHLMNSLNLFLPSFERMIMRTVLDKIIPRLTDRSLLEQARGFAGQEASHSRAHELFIENLRAQGYDLDRYLMFTEWFFEDLLEQKLGYKLGLSVIAGFEHYTDLLVMLVLQGEFFDGCDPRMKELFAWHAAEEVEHNAVAFAMLCAIDDGYGLRMVGNVLGLSIVLGFMVSGAALLLHQDKKLGDRETARELGEFFFTKYGAARDIVKLFQHYSRRDYRPDDADYSGLARGVLEPDLVG
jgi:predicted metal-dependent hydrolase